MIINNFRQRLVYTIIVIVFHSILFIGNLYSVENNEDEISVLAANNIQYKYNFKI